jgi:hypothetical protein
MEQPKEYVLEYGEVTIDVQSKTSSKTETKSIKVPVFKGIEPAKVSYSNGLTLSGEDYGVSQYNPIKINVHISMPCLPEESEVKATLQKVKNWVTQFLAEEEEDLRVSK